jgi:hypothetical protein
VYTPLPPHFQPRRLIAADMDKVNAAPPPLPSYEQPTIPAQGYLWVPGFWAWRKSVPDYFWVPGTWVQPPQPGLLWTPPYWSRVDGGYAFHAGYWAAEIGFYGGINYGYGYPGDGYQGGRWENGVFSYNRAVNNLGSLGITNVYDQSVTADDNYAMKGDDVGYCIEILSYPDPAERRMRQASLEKAQQEHVAAFPATIAKLEREYIAARARGADQDWLVTLADELQDVRQKYAKALIDIQHPVRLSPPEQGIEK